MSTLSDKLQQVDDWIDSQDPADKVLMAGILSIGAGASILAVVPATAVLGTVMGVGAVSSGIAFTVTGAYAKTQPLDRQREIRDTVRQTAEAVKVATAPLSAGNEWLEDRLEEWTSSRDLSLDEPDLESPVTTEEKTAADLMKDITLNAGKSLLDVVEHLLEVEREPSPPENSDTSAADQSTDHPQCVPCPATENYDWQSYVYEGTSFEGDSCADSSSSENSQPEIDMGGPP
jgi:hypothetical protein